MPEAKPQCLATIAVTEDSTEIQCQKDEHHRGRHQVAVSAWSSEIQRGWCTSTEATVTW